MADYEIFFKDGNRKIYQAPNLIELAKTLNEYDNRLKYLIYKIEERKND